MSELKSPAQFRAEIIKKYSDHFNRYQKAVQVVEDAVHHDRELSSDTRMTLDMLMTQCYKAHASVYVLAVRAQIEDASTIVRRMLELAVQSMYAGANGDEEAQTGRAGAFLAHLWDTYPIELRDRLPASERERWEAFLTEHSALLPRRKRPWGLDFRSMCKAVGVESVYSDYQFLSGIAHGIPPSLVTGYSSSKIDLRPDYHVPLVLGFSNRYAVVTLREWNRAFGIVSAKAMKSLEKLVTETEF